MLDNLILLVFGILTPFALAVGVFGFWMAIRASKRKESDLRMFFWAVLGLAGFVFSMVSFVYFLLPIISARVLG